MDIKEIGTCGVFVVGGVVYGVSQYGLDGALSEELRHIEEVSYEERPAYMEQVVGEFAEAFAVYGVETETYTYGGYSKFSASPKDGEFVEVVTQEEVVPTKEIINIRAYMKEADFCGQTEMTMFTEKGWSYRFTMTDSQGRNVYAITCAPPTPKLRGTS